MEQGWDIVGKWVVGWECAGVASERWSRAAHPHWALMECDECGVEEGWDGACEWIVGQQCADVESEGWNTDRFTEWNRP